jgi:hypothetical protein
MVAGLEQNRNGVIAPAPPGGTRGARAAASSVEAQFRGVAAGGLWLQPAVARRAALAARSPTSFAPSLGSTVDRPGIEAAKSLFAPDARKGYGLFVNLIQV